MQGVYNTRRKGVKSTMYRLRHRITHHYALYAGLALAGALVIGGVFAARNILQPHTSITQSPGVTRFVGASSSSTQHVAKSIFTLDLPAGWTAASPPNTPYTIYSWQGGLDTLDTARRLDVYIDRLPVNLAVNRLLPVQATDDRLDAVSETSDNCSNFTDKAAASATTGAAPSKWAGVNFLCDMGNYERDVVGIGSAEGINSVTLIGPTAGAHHVFMTYTDNSANPDFTIFLAIVRSFRLT